MSDDPHTKQNLKIVVNTKELSHMLNFAFSIVEKRNVIAELKNVRLVAKGNKLEIGATDLDLYLKQTLGVQVIQEGKTSVSIQTLAEIVKKISDDEITLEQDEQSENLKLTCRSCHFDLLTLPATKFPAMEDFLEENSLSIECLDLARIIEYTKFAMSTEETRYNLNGIYLHIKNNEFCSAATDAHRVSVASIVINSKTDSFGVIVPSKTVDELLKIIKDKRNINLKINIFLGDNKIKFQCNDLILVSKLIDGTFPDYTNFIPVENTNKLVINREMLTKSIDRVATVTVDKFKGIKFVLTASELTISGFGETKGFASEVITFSEEEKKYAKFSGDGISVGLDARYILEVLGVLKEEQVQLYFDKLSSPVLIKTTQNPNDNFVIMPVKI